jgi:hypothetical protein
MTTEFNHSHYAWKKDIDYRRFPEAYKVGKGEQGVLICEPYRSEILPYWKFKTPTIAQESSQHILKLFYDYLDQQDFIGADLARKFLQMGFTRAKRYTNYKGGRKYRDKERTLFPKGSGDPEKAISAKIFYKAWKKAEAEPRYQQWKIEWKQEKG